MTADPLLRFRDEFPILARSTYMVSNSLGAMPRAVPERLIEYAESWAKYGVRAWARHWWEMPLTVGDLVAPLIGAEPRQVAMAPTVTLAQSAILTAMDFRSGRDTIVMTDLDFPSVRYAFDHLGPRLGARIVVVKSEDGIGLDQAKLHAAIDERTALVAVSHVAFRSAFVLDADALCAHAHAMGAVVSLDAYHSVGVIPVDVKRSGVDFLTGGVLKWLCGGPGGCFLYASSSASERFAPALTGWMAHQRPFAFEGSMAYADGIQRWLGGTPSGPAASTGGNFGLGRGLNIPLQDNEFRYKPTNRGGALPRRRIIAESFSPGFLTQPSPPSRSASGWMNSPPPRSLVPPASRRLRPMATGSTRQRPHGRRCTLAVSWTTSRHPSN